MVFAGCEVGQETLVGNVHGCFGAFQQCTAALAAGSATQARSPTNANASPRFQSTPGRRPLPELRTPGVALTTTFAPWLHSFRLPGLRLA
jgi:hypothetical protein